jgi:hypothetical protein
MTDYLVPTQSNVSHVETELAGLFALRTEILRVPLTLFNLYLSLDVFYLTSFGATETEVSVG